MVIVKPGAGTTCDKQDRNNCHNYDDYEHDNADYEENTLCIMINEHHIAIILFIVSIYFSDIIIYLLLMFVLYCCIVFVFSDRSPDAPADTITPEELGLYCLFVSFFSSFLSSH